MPAMQSETMRARRVVSLALARSRHGGGRVSGSDMKSAKSSRTMRLAWLIMRLTRWWRYMRSKRNSRSGFWRSAMSSEKAASGSESALTSSTFFGFAAAARRVNSATRSLTHMPMRRRTDSEDDNGAGLDIRILLHHLLEDFTGERHILQVVDLEQTGAQAILDIVIASLPASTKLVAGNYKGAFHHRTTLAKFYC